MTPKIVLTLLLAALVTIPLWPGLEQVHSAPAVLASPPPAAIPEVKLVDVPAQALIGEQFKFKVTFDNIGSAVGYAPFIDVILPAHGIDGATPCDGISTSVDAMMVGVNNPLPVKTYSSLTTPCGTVPGTTIPHPYSASGVLPVVVPPGGQLLTLELPFGSFEPAQPKIEVEITVDLHNFADVGQKLTIYARGGFRFGLTEHNDFSTDPPILTNSGNPLTANWESKDVIPTVFIVSKSYLGPEGEAVSGPNFVGYYPLRYQVSVNIAKGQKITNLEIDDCLENNMSFVGLVGGLTTAGSTASFTSPCLHLSYGTVMGTSSPSDIVVTYEFFITQFVDGTKTPVLDPEICVNTTSTNKAVASGDWTPLDTRDTPMKVSGSAKYTLNDKRLAIQKSVKVKVVGKKGQLVDKGDLPIPGDYLEYRLRFQVSDYFTFGDIVINDLISDGQRFVQTAPAGSAFIRVTDRFGTSKGNFTNADLVVEESEDECKGVKGGTRLIFKVSQAMMNLSSFAWHNQGIMTGGHAMTPTSPVPAEGDIIFYVQIQDEFSHQGNDKEKKYVDKHDPLNNCVAIGGQIYRNSKDNEPKPLGNKDAACSDDSGTSLMIKPDVLQKAIIARNGKPLNTSFKAPPKFAADDTITFSISKTIPSGDWEKLKIQDWAPLPVLDTNTLNFSTSLLSCGGNFPAAGQVCLNVPNDNVGQPLTMVHNIDNSFTFDYGTQNNPANTPKTIEIWYSLKLTNKPFADGLFLTNEVQECEFNTFGVQFCQVAVARFELTEPSLRITKGVVWAGSGKSPVKKNPSAVYTPSPASTVTFSGPPSCPSFSGVIKSSDLSTTPISSDVSNVDAFDTVLFAIVVENRGSGLNGAFDVLVKDTLPPGLTLVSPVCVTYGDGTLIGTTNPAPLFGPGVMLVDPSATQGALAPYDPSSTSNGHNIAVITFYAQIDKGIRPSCYPNKAELLNYATTEGGPSFVKPAGFGGPFTDIANVCVLPKAEKCVTATSEPHTQPGNSLDLAPPQPPKVAIGEIVRYRLQVKIPEGVSTGLFITDNLPSGMTFMNDNTTRVLFIDDGGLTSNVAAVATLNGLHIKGNKVDCHGPKPTALLPSSQINPGAFAPGVAPSFSLGTLTNSENDTNDEYVVVEFNALVNNLPPNASALPNKDGVTLSNSYDVFVKGAPKPAATSNTADVKIVEPKLDVLKTASPASVLPGGGVVTFTIKVTNNGTTDAFDVLMTDPLPAFSGLSMIPNTASVSSSCSTPTLNTTTGDVSVPRMPVLCSVTETFKALVTAKCPTASVTNTANASYSSLPWNGTFNGTPVGTNNLTGSITPGASGASNGERQYKSSGQVTVPLICTGSLTVTKTIKNQTTIAPPASTVFPVSVSCSPSGPNVTLTLTASSPTQTVSNIPVGSTCTVTEGALPPPIAHPACPSLGWGTPTYLPGQTIVIQTAGSNVTVLVQNTYTCKPSACATPPSGMVAWWPLDETSGSLLHSIVGNHDATTQPAAIGAGGPSVATAPKVGSALFFGVARAEASNDPALNFGTGNFSIDAWVRSNQSTLLSAVVDKLDTGTPVPRGYAFFVQNGMVQLVMADGTSISTFQSSNTFIANGTWRHVAVTVRRTGGVPVGQFYIDGNPAGATFTPLPGNINSNATLFIARYRLSTSACSCEVSLDEIELFNTAVSFTDIKAIFNAGSAGKCKTAISGLKFNDQNGNGLRDTGEPGLAK